MLNFSRTTKQAQNAHTERKPRLAIRKNQPLPRKFAWKKLLIGGFSTASLLGIISSVLLVMLYIQHLKADKSQLQSQVSMLQVVGRENAQLAEWFTKAFGKTQATAFVPQLGGINGGGTHYANGEHVIPVAASREALRNGSVMMGDYILLVGQIKDMKSPLVKGHSFDVQVPDLALATMFGKRPFKFANLSHAPTSDGK